MPAASSRRSASVSTLEPPLTGRVAEERDESDEEEAA